MDNSLQEEDKRTKSKNPKIPKAVPFILFNILLERYSTTGISGKFQKIWWNVHNCEFLLKLPAVLVLYLNRKLNFDQSISTAIFHTNELLAYLFTIFGAVIADSWLGLFKTITLMSLVFSVGSVIVGVAAIEVLNLPTLWVTKSVFPVFAVLCSFLIILSVRFLTFF